MPSATQQGLQASYYDNATFAGSVEKSIPLESNAFTRTESAINFSTRGFSFFEQYFLLPFANETGRRQWRPDIDTATDNYPFSVKFVGYVTVPPHIQSLELMATGGDAQLTLDGNLTTENRIDSPAAGTHTIAVQYARNLKDKPSLKLFWLGSNGKEPIPASAFSKATQPKTTQPKTLPLPWYDFAALLLWLAGLVVALKQIQPAISWNQRSSAWLIFILLTLYACVNLQRDGRKFNFQIFQVGHDWLNYESLARDIGRGDWISAGEGQLVFLNFGYRYLLALMHWLAGEAPANAMLLQRALMAACVAFAVYAAQKLYGTRTAFALGLIIVTCKYFIAFAEPLLDTVFGISLSFGMLYCLIRYSREHTRTWIISASVLLGFSLLIRANFLPFVLVTPFWIYLCVAPCKRNAIKIDLSLFIACALLIFSLIGLRNYWVSGQWVFLPTNGLFNLWLGNHPPEFDGSTYFAARVPPATEIIKRVIDYSLAEPAALAARTREKALFIFGIDQKHRLHADIALPWLIACCGSVSLWHKRSIRPELILLWLWIALVNAPLLILFPWGYGWRLSAPAFLPLYLICALSIAHWSQKLMCWRAGSPALKL